MAWGCVHKKSGNQLAPSRGLRLYKAPVAFRPRFTSEPVKRKEAKEGKGGRNKELRGIKNNIFVSASIRDFGVASRFGVMAVIFVYSKSLRFLYENKLLLISPLDAGSRSHLLNADGVVNAFSVMTNV